MSKNTHGDCPFRPMSTLWADYSHQDNTVERVECPDCGKVNHIPSYNRNERTTCWQCEGIIGSQEERLNVMLASYEIAREAAGER